MAVPSKNNPARARQAARSQHKIAAPTYNACPQCHSPRLPHRVCPECGHLRQAPGRDAGRPASARGGTSRNSRSRRARRRPRAAGGGRRRRGAPRRAGIRSVPVRPRGRAAAGARRRLRTAHRGRRRPDRDRERRGAGARPCARSTTRRSCRPRTAVADGRADALVTAGSTGAALAAALLHVKRHARRVPPGGCRAAARPGTAGAAPRRRRERRGAARAPRPVRAHGRRLQRGRARRRAAAGRAAARSARSREGNAGRGRGARAAARAERRSSSSGNVEGDDVVGGKADVVVTDGFTGNVALKLMEGTLRTLGRSDPRCRHVRHAFQARRPAVAPELASCATSSTPRRVGGAYLLGLRGPVVICHGWLQPARDRERDRARRARRRGASRGEDGRGARSLPAGQRGTAGETTDADGALLVRHTLLASARRP